jgi:hypothetical protein
VVILQEEAAALRAEAIIGDGAVQVLLTELAPVVRDGVREPPGEPGGAQAEAAGVGELAVQTVRYRAARHRITARGAP